LTLSEQYGAIKDSDEFQQEYLLWSTFADPEPIALGINVCYSCSLISGIEWKKVNLGDTVACLKNNS
jgi:hypothetical protein